VRVAILTLGRFHVCDLARELDALGHEVAFYSLVPPWRTRRFGLPDRCNRWLGPYLAPFYAAAYAARGSRVAPAFDAMLTTAFDHLASKLVNRCHVFIGMSGLSNFTSEAVRRKYGAKIFIERGSRHILSQREILEAIQRSPLAPLPVMGATVRRELADYEIADTIVVPAKHVMRSFIDRGVAERRLFCNPYGVSLEMFPPTDAPPREPPTILMAGTWSLRKGCDVLTDAWRRLPGTRLIHVGSIGDAMLPTGEGFEHVPPVEQRRLSAIYARGHVFALASREEGLALVQAQALASGLPLVCTDRTGGEDLGEMLEDRTLVSLVPCDDAAVLADSLSVALERVRDFVGRRDLLGNARNRLSWRAYGERYDRTLRERA
jgi:glycosyltransferase involved in cell wall biosynthesis